MGDFRRDARGERCWQCGAPVRPGAVECRNCGAQLVGDADESAYLPARRPERPEPRRRGSAGGAGRQGRYDEPDRYDEDPADDDYDDRRPGARAGRDDRADRADPRRPRAGGDDRRNRDSRGERDDRSGRADRGRRYTEPVYDESVEAPALDPSAEYPAYADDSREDYAYRDNRSDRGDRGDRASRDGRRGAGARDDLADEPTLRPGRGESRAGRGSRNDDANQPDPFDDPRAPSAFRPSRSRPLDERDAFPADPRRNARGAQPSRSRSRSGTGYDDFPPNDPRMGGMAGGRGPQGGRGIAPGADPRMGGGMGGGRPMGGLNGPMPPQGMNGGPGMGMGGMGMAPGGLMPPIPGGPLGAPAKPAQKRRGTVGIVIGVIAALLVIAIVVSILFIPKIRHHIPGLNGGSPSSPANTSAFSTYTPGPTPTVLANDKLFSSTQSQYILNYPASWGVKNNSNATGGQYDNYDTFSQPSGVATMGVEQAGQFASVSDQQIIQSEVTSVEAASKTAKVTQIGANVTQTIGGETWQRAEYTIVNGSSTFHMSLLACHHNGKGYAIVLLDTAGNFRADDQTIFEPSLRSFRFS